MNLFENEIITEEELERISFRFSAHNQSTFLQIK
jgi:hypothetical protein